MISVGLAVFGLGLVCLGLGFYLGKLASRPARGKPAYCTNRGNAHECIISWGKGDLAYNGVRLPCRNGYITVRVWFRNGKAQPWHDQHNRPVPPVAYSRGCLP